MSYGYSTTGRTASTSSIYDYPEHLNPFYEDENHKRLRFWQFGNHRSDKPRSERRGSLVSIRDGLRDMWEFKTFRLKKKRSSSLGINKTSESPPPLRREDVDSHYNTISNASAYRNTINTVGYGPGYSQSTTTTPLFQRNSRYRSTMQDQSKENGIGLHRNDRYRSTIQNGYATYSGSMVTSTPRSRYDVTGTTGRGMTAGVSQSSLKSTNPFDDDEMDDSVSLNDSFNSGAARQSMTRQRKKRRAPPPPPVRNLANISVDSTNTVLATRLKIEESPPPEDQEDVNNLTNLTAEIESFVRTTSDDEVNRTTTEQVNQAENLASTNDTNNNHVTELIIVERKGDVEMNNESNTERLEQNLAEVDGSPKASEPAPTNDVNIPEPVEQISRIEVLRIEETESQPITPPQPSPRSKTSPPPIPETPPVVETEDLENLALPETPVPARRHNRNRNQVPQPNGNTLRITESSDSATASTTEEDENMESKAIKPINYEFQYKVEPIRTNIDEKIGSARLKISESTGDINSYQNAGTERRRSVRDIIESINKSQSLLKVNHETGTLHSAQSNDSVNRNMRELNDREKEIQRMLHEMEANFSNVQREPYQMSSVPPPTTKRGSYYDNVPDGDENLDNLDDRNNLLSKSALRSKKSPTKSLGIEQPDDGQFQDCIDWNPLPKPRRSRHFPDSQTNQSTSAATGGVLTVINQNNNGTTNQS